MKKERFYIKESNLINKSDGGKTKIFLLMEKGFWSDKMLDYGNSKWLWYENGESIFGQDSFRYFTSLKEAQKCLDNLTK